MIFKSNGNIHKPVILLLHGGGLSDWSLEPIAYQFAQDYHVITTVIDGHGQESCHEFVSIENCAQQIISYITENFNGKIHAICGLSIGAQIICEVLAKEKSMVQYAVIESALACPIKLATALTIPAYHITFWLIQKRWFSNLQAKALCVPEAQFEDYYKDSSKMTKQSLINITKSNGNYELKPSIANTSAHVLIIVGEKEIPIMKKSAHRIHQTLKGSKLLIAPKLKHGEFSLVHGNTYGSAVTQWLSEGGN